MTLSGGGRIPIGPYLGEVAPDFQSSGFLADLALLPSRLADAAPSNASGRHRMAVISLAAGGRRVELAVKAFSRQGALKDVADRLGGTKAFRSWRAAHALRAHSVGTPEPAAYLERWRRGRLEESYYLSIFQPGVANFRDELCRLYIEDPVCEKIMTILELVAREIRAMHEAGVVHGDLGNQNILLRREGDGIWRDVQFVDLNRARIGREISLRDRARDLSRIDLPSDFLRVFKVMYFPDGRPPREFERWERRYRRQFAFHTRTRRLRHPWRDLGPTAAAPAAPRWTDLWIWDERSGQAISVLQKRDRNRCYPKSNLVRIIQAVAAGAWPVMRAYRGLKRQCYRQPVNLAGRIGLALHPTPERLPLELEYLNGLGAIPVLIRLYRHEPPDRQEFCLSVVRQLAAAGHAVSLALVQDRKAVLDPGLWDEFVSRALDRVHDVVDWVEVGHAINRVKWGIWSLDEYARLLQPAARLARTYPSVKWMGPAVIDFEYPFLAAALDRARGEFHFDALSHHLYVDRRGAPENRQGRFSALEKCVLARAIAERSPACGNRLIVSEANWPLAGTGVYSPVGSPYEAPGPRLNDPSVSEEDYGHFMIRYLATALCSGMVERFFWWRLAARGYGLVDDSGPAQWRPRPAYFMLKNALSLVGDGTFVKKLPTSPGLHILIFDRLSGGQVALAYSSSGPQEIQAPFEFDRTLDAVGREVGPSGSTIRLTGAPSYFFLASNRSSSPTTARPS